MAKLWIISDLHLEFMQEPWRPAHIPDHDILVLAGDIHVGCENAVSYAKELTDQPVILLAGNHEFYHRHLQHEYRCAATSSEATQNVRFLENAETVIDGIRFIGATLWTDFLLGGEHCYLDNIDAAQRFLNDFDYIAADGSKNGSPAAVRFSPHHAAERHKESVAHIKAALAQPFDGPTVVVTHHAPHPGSIHPRFKGDPLTAAFVSDRTPVMTAGAPDLWIHGHVHDCFDYRVGKTRILCNPHGYPGENAKFDEALVVDV